MDKEIYAIIKALERQYHAPAQIVVERSKEAKNIIRTGITIGSEQHFYPPHDRIVYGALEDRRCEVVALPTDNPEIRHDVDQMVGIYHSIKDVNKKIKEIDWIDLFCALSNCTFHDGLRQHLAQKYEIKEKLAYYAHGSYADWYTVDGVEAELSDWKETRPDLFQESVQYLKDNKIPFLYNASLTATINGVYTSGHGDLVILEGEALEEFFTSEDVLEGITLTKKIADIKLELLK